METRANYIAIGLFVVLVRQLLPPDAEPAALDARRLARTPATLQAMGA